MLINIIRSEEDLEGSSKSKPAFSRGDNAERCGSALSCARLAASSEGSVVLFADGGAAGFSAFDEVPGAPDRLVPDDACGMEAISAGEEFMRDVLSSPPPHPVSKRVNGSIQRAREKVHNAFTRCRGRQ